MGLQGERVALRPLTRPDLDEIEAWAPFTDPLYRDWNRYPWHRLGKDLWLDLESLDPAAERYAIVDSQRRVIGVVGLVDVDGAHRPLLSVFLGSHYCDQGLGTEALRVLIRHAFVERGLAAIRLSVAATNARARRAYEKCGFHVTRRSYRPVAEDESLAFLDEARYRGLRRYLRQEDGCTYLLFYEMEIGAAAWQAHHGEAAPPGTAQ